MGRNTRKKVEKGGPLQREYDAKQVDKRSVPVLSVFTAQHGDYQREGNRGTINRGGTPVARWTRDDLLTVSQQAAIAHCIRLWQAISSSGRLVANLDQTVFGCPGDGNVAEIEARSDLHRIKSYFTLRQWDCFENVVRFDEPAGVAGSRLESKAHTREMAARMVVQFVADIIVMKERLSY